MRGKWRVKVISSWWFSIVIGMGSVFTGTGMKKMIIKCSDLKGFGKITKTKFLCKLCINELCVGPGVIKSGETQKVTLDLSATSLFFMLSESPP